MTSIGTLQRLIQDSDEEDSNFFHPETVIFVAVEANRPILDFSDSGSDSEDESSAISQAVRFQEPIESSLNFVLGDENSQIFQPTESIDTPGTSQSSKPPESVNEKPKKRIKTKGDAFDSRNYKTFVTHLRTKKYETSIKPKGKKGPTLNVTWTNQFNLFAPGCKRARNVPGDQCGVPLGKAKEAHTHLDACSLFFDKKDMKLLVTETNNNIREKMQKLPEKVANSIKYPFLHLTNEILFGLLYNRGLMGLSKVKASCLLEKKRFTLLLGQLRFDDKASR